MLNQGVGYSVVLGFGAFFAVFTSFLVPVPQLIHPFPLACTTSLAVFGLYFSCESKNHGIFGWKKAFLFTDGEVVPILTIWYA